MESRGKADPLAYQQALRALCAEMGRSFHNSDSFVLAIYALRDRHHVPNAVLRDMVECFAGNRSPLMQEFLG